MLEHKWSKVKFLAHLQTLVFLVYLVAITFFH